MSSFSDFYSASYKGVPFQAISFEISSEGRRNAVHNYPYREDFYIEDMGKSLAEWEITGFLAGNILSSSLEQLKALRKVCESKGPGLLMHPSEGPMANMSCRGMSFSVREGNYVEVSLRFVQASTSSARLSIFPIFGIDLSSTLQSISDNIEAFNTAKAMFVSDVDAVLIPFQAIGTDVSRTINSVKNITAFVSCNVGRYFSGNSTGTGIVSASAVSSAVTSLLSQSHVAVSNLNQAIIIANRTTILVAPASTPSALTQPQAINNVIAAAIAVYPHEIDQLNQLINLPPINNDYVNVQVLATVASIVATYQPTSSAEATTVLSSLIPMFEKQIYTSTDADIVETLSGALNTIIKTINMRAINLPSYVTINTNGPKCSLVLSYELYGDSDRAGELLGDNPTGLILPTSLSVLSS